MALIHNDDPLPSRYVAAPSTDEAWDIAFAEWRGKVTGSDLGNELADVEDLLATLAHKGDAEKIGRVVIAVFDAYAHRLADREVYGKQTLRAKWPAEAAALALAGLQS